MTAPLTADLAIDLLVSRASGQPSDDSSPEDAARAGAVLRTALQDLERDQSELAEALIANQDRLLAMTSIAQINVQGVASDQTIGLLLNEALRLTGASMVALFAADGIVSTAGDTAELAAHADIAWRAIADSPNDPLRHTASGDGIIATLDPDGLARNYLALFRPADRPFSTVDVPVVEGVVSSLGVMLAFNELHQRALASAAVEREHQLASDLAQSVITVRPPQSARLDVFAQTVPAARTGGDFYVFGRTDQIVWFAVGDVAGKDLPAAMLMTRAVAACRVAFLTHRDASVGDVFASIEDELFDYLDEVGLFITMAVGAIDESTSTVSLASAGHSPVVWVNSTGASLIPATSPPIGVIRHRIPQASEFVLHAGDCLVIGSDGLAEQSAPDGSMFGYDRFLDLCHSVRLQSSAQQGQAVFDTVNAFAAGRHASDDSTLVIVQTLAEAS